MLGRGSGSGELGWGHAGRGIGGVVALVLGIGLDIDSGIDSSINSGTRRASSRQAGQYFRHIHGLKHRSNHNQTTFPFLYIFHYFRILRFHLPRAGDPAIGIFAWGCFLIG
jgi:hypothetical protein